MSTGNLDTACHAAYNLILFNVYSPEFLKLCATFLGVASTFLERHADLRFVNVFPDKKKRKGGGAQNPI